MPTATKPIILRYHFGNFVHLTVKCGGRLQPSRYYGSDRASSSSSAWPLVTLQQQQLLLRLWRRQLHLYATYGAAVVRRRRSTRQRSYSVLNPSRTKIGDRSPVYRHPGRLSLLPQRGGKWARVKLWWSCSCRIKA